MNAITENLNYNEISTLKMALSDREEKLTASLERANKLIPDDTETINFWKKEIEELKMLARKIKGE
jgi:hypothetical protein